MTDAQKGTKRAGCGVDQVGVAGVSPSPPGDKQRKLVITFLNTTSI